MRSTPLCVALIVACLTQAFMAAPATAAQYIVDASHPAADDGNPGSEAKPLKTVQRGVDMAQAGDTVCVMEGVYNEKITLKNSGRPEAWIALKGLPRQKAEIKGLDTGGASYVRVEGFRFTDEGVRIGSDHIEILDNYFHEVRRETVNGTGADIHVAYNRSYAPSAGFTASGSNWLVECNEVERMVHKTVECDYGRFFGRGHTFRHNYFHGTAQAEVAKSHVDGFQTWHREGKAGEQAHDMSFIENVVYNFHQAIIARSAEKDDFLGNFTIRGNVFAHGLLPNDKGAAVGIILENVHGATVEHNLIADVQWFAFSPSGVTRGNLRDTIVYRCGNWDRGRRPESFLLDHNLAFENKLADLADKLIEKDPLFIDPAADNWRLKPDSPAIGAGTSGSAIGPFAWPNQYTVDARHPGASDKGLGHPGQPLKTLAHALSVAKAGETIIVRGGVYRESVAATADNVTVRAAEGQSVVLSGADLVEGWQRGGDEWTAPLPKAPKVLLRDGKPWTQFKYDAATATLRVTGFDPRLSLMETVVREHALDLAGKKLKVEGISTANTLGQGIVGGD